MERFIAWMVIERMSQPLSYSWGVREHFQLSHFSSRSQVHGRGGINSHYVLYLFILYDQHVVPRRIVPYSILYDDVLRATCGIEIGIYLVVCGGNHMILGVHHWHQIVYS